MKATIKEVAAYLERVGLQYMATIGLDGKPKVRPVQFIPNRSLGFLSTVWQ